MRDMMGMMKQAQAMQAKLQTAQAELETIEVEGAAAGGMVKVVMSAKGALMTITIDPSLMLAEEREILEDLIIAACNDGRQRGERVMQERMAEVTKGIPLPPGMKLF